MPWNEGNMRLERGKLVSAEMQALTQQLCRVFPRLPEASCPGLFRETWAQALFNAKRQWVGRVLPEAYERGDIDGEELMQPSPFVLDDQLEMVLEGTFQGQCVTSEGCPPPPPGEPPKKRPSGAPGLIFASLVAAGVLIAGIYLTRPDGRA